MRLKKREEVHFCFCMDVLVEVRQLMFLVLWLCIGGMFLFHVCGDGRGIVRHLGSSPDRC